MTASTSSSSATEVSLPIQNDRTTAVQVLWNAPIKLTMAATKNIPRHIMNSLRRKLGESLCNRLVSFKRNMIIFNFIMFPTQGGMNGLWTGR